MTSPAEHHTQKHILTALERKWREYPSLRFGQLIMNIYATNNIVDMFYCADRDTLEMIDEYPAAHEL